MSVVNGIAKTGQTIFRPLIQGGFAAFATFLLAILTWTIYAGDQRFDRLLETQRETNQVVERNTAAVNELRRAVDRMGK